VWVKLFLDPNGDGFTSKTTAGFIGDDQTDSEILIHRLFSLWLNLIVIWDLVLIVCFTDFVDHETAKVQLFDNGTGCSECEWEEMLLMLKVIVF
jgi:hypothetical protein